jgi:hypothetical protein
MNAAIGFAWIDAALMQSILVATEWVRCVTFAPTGQNQLHPIGRDIRIGHAIRGQVWRHARQHGGGRVKATKREIVVRGRRRVMERAKWRRSTVVAVLNADGGA